MKVQGIIRGNTVLVQGNDLDGYEGELVTITLPDRQGKKTIDKMASFERWKVLSAEIRRQLPEGFDPQQELLNALDEKYGRTN